MDQASFVSRIAAVLKLEHADNYFLKTTELQIIEFEELARNSGVNKKWKIRYANGVCALFKPGEQFGNPYQAWPERSVATFLIDRLLGLHLVPTTAIVQASIRQESIRGSAMVWIDDASPPSDLGLTNDDRPDEMKLLDAVTGNRDRKETDWLIAANGLVSAIDNDSTFRHDDLVQGSEMPVWKHELSEIRDGFKKREYAKLLQSISDESVNAAIQGLELKYQNRFRQTFPMIVDFLKN